jgi:hypothetical protein
MNLIVTIDEAVQEEALEAARNLNTRSISREGGLPAPLSDVIQRWVDRAWDQIEQALRDALREGRAAAQDAIEATTNVLSEAANELGDRVTEVEMLLRQRLDVYFRGQIERSFARVQSTITIGERKLVATGATVAQTLKFSSSLKAKLDDICSFLAESQIAVTVSYGL